MKIRRRYLTLRGGMLASVAFVILFAAINYQRNALFWTGYSVLTLFVVGMLISVVAARESTLKWDWEVPLWIFANDTLVINGKWLAPNPSPLVVWTSPGLKGLPHRISDLTPGVFKISQATGFIEYPLGIVKTSVAFSIPPEIWVYPAPVNHLGKTHSSVNDDSDPVNLRNYRDGDQPNRILKKTQSLPSVYWRTRTNASERKEIAHEMLSWFDMPDAWTSLMKAEQLSYEIKQMPQDVSFSLELEDGEVHTGRGVSHQHQCWQLLARHST